MTRQIAAFTLIELLIVVAIIAILAAIAVPNFMLAQARAKVSRVVSDQSTLALALESYSVDNNNKYAAYGNSDDVITPTNSLLAFVPTRVTTPVSYISALPPDIFPGFKNGLVKGKTYTFFYRHNYAETYLGKSMHAGHVEEHYKSLTGSNRPVQWTAWSFGPDLDDDHGIVLYDPTNGVISNGDFMKFGP